MGEYICNKLWWITLGLWLSFSSATMFAANLLDNSSNLLQSIPLHVNKPITVDLGQTTVPKTGFIAGITSIIGQTNPGVVAAAIGGTLGSVTSTLFSQTIGSVLGQDYPYETIAVNVMGCFAFGLVSGAVGPGSASQNFMWFTMIKTSFFGAFTNFSSFTDDVIELNRDKGIFTASSYTAFTVSASVLAMLIGEQLGIGFFHL